MWGPIQPAAAQFDITLSSISDLALNLGSILSPEASTRRGTFRLYLAAVRLVHRPFAFLPSGTRTEFDLTTLDLRVQFHAVAICKQPSHWSGEVTMKRLHLSAILSLVAFLAWAGTAEAASVTLTFDELPFQPVDGLSFMGVTFHFTVGGVPSTDANYDSGGPGTITYVQDPSLEGDAAGTLTLNFGAPTPVLQFGIALSTFSALPAGCSVELFDSNLTSLGVFDVATAGIVSFSESRFSYHGQPISQATITFYSPAGRFALDNLTFDNGLTATTTRDQQHFAPGGKPWN